MKKTFTLTLILLMITANAWAAKVRTRSEDMNGDGTIDNISVFQLDDGNRVTSATFDDDADGSVDRNQTVTRTATEKISEFRDSGTNVLLSSNTSTNDASSRIVSWVFDRDGNGSNDSTITWAYTGTGTDNYTVTHMNGARVAHTKTFVKDGNTVTTMDQYPNGAHDWIRVSTLDSRGRSILRNHDDDADGSVDRIQTTTYSSTGSYSEIRNAETNALLSTTTITHDSSLRALTHETDSDGDGAADSTITHSYIGTGEDNYTITYRYGGTVIRTTSIVVTEE